MATMRSTLGPLIMPERWGNLFTARGRRRVRKRANRAYARLRRMLKVQGPLGTVHIENRPEVIGRWMTPAEVLAGPRSAPASWGLRPGAAYWRARGRVIIRERGRMTMLWVEP